MHFKYDPEKYPKKPVYTKNQDEQGRDYYVGYSNTQGFCSINIGNKGENANWVYEGNPKITYRKGESKHGPEIFFELLVSKFVEKRVKNTNHNSIEIYMPYEKGIEFLKRALLYFETNESFSNNT